VCCVYVGGGTGTAAGLAAEPAMAIETLVVILLMVLAAAIAMGAIVSKPMKC
jgi:hypothetical protein